MPNISRRTTAEIADGLAPARQLRDNLLEY
jgi:hypothetical protein